MTIRIYNTLTRKQEELRPIEKGKVSMYVCGPTVYDEPHIGHARSAYVFDVIRRYLDYRRYKVTFVRNVTDVDDKIIDKAREQFKGEDLNSAVKKVSGKYLNSYHKYMDALGIRRPDIEPKATDYIDRMRDFIADLIHRGVAYESEGDVYFDVKKAGSYGKLSNQSLEMLESGARISPGENKKDPLDFSLWKKAKGGEPSWSSLWGPGRPGWHIECSVMSSGILGDEFDIHGGGIDLIFPHHENELAQSEGAGNKFARYWIHNGLLTINKEKMAKSLGNFVSVDEVLNKYPADVLKLLFLQVHYSKPMDFSWEKMEEAQKARERICILLDKLDMLKVKEGSLQPSALSLQRETDSFRKRFEEAMDDDFNTSKGLAVLFELVTYVNKGIGHRAEGIGWDYARDTLLELGGVFGLFEGKRPPPVKIGISEEKIKELIDRRNRAREKKDYEAADKIREKLDKVGVVLEDNKDGTTWRLKK